MTFGTGSRAAAAILLIGMLSACGGSFGGGGASLTEPVSNTPAEFDPTLNEDGSDRETIFDLFASNPDENVTVEVNKYLWNASLDILNFMPIQSVDPFSGVIVMGYGTPPGGGTSYRATVLVRDPALEARSLKVSLQSRRGPVDADTQRAVEDAILTRARQLRIRDGNL